MNKTINKINNQLEQFKTSIDTIINQNNQHINSIKRYENKDFTIQKKEGELPDQTKLKAETLLDQLEDIKKRNELILQNVNEFEQKIEEMNKEVNELKTYYLKEQENTQIKINEIVQVIVDSIETIKEKEMKKFDDEIKRYQSDYSNKIILKYEKNDLIKYNGMIDIEEKKQLEEWTGLTCGEILFDSDKDNWSLNSSVFDSKIMNKSYLLFVIEDTTNNKFGYYLNGTINKYNFNLKYKGSFMFSLKSNGRVNGMHIFEEKDYFAGYRLYPKSENLLFHTYGGIYIFKEKSKTLSYIFEDSYYYDFHGITKAFHPKLSEGKNKFFTPNRICVIQMN